jgi:hypothetical protein
VGYDTGAIEKQPRSLRGACQLSTGIGSLEDDMGEKETGEATPTGRTRHGISVTLDDKEGARRATEASPATAGDAATDAGDATLKTRHDTVKNSIGNIR